MTPVLCEAPEPQLHAGLDKLVRMGAPYLPFSSCLGVMIRFCCLLGTSCPHLSRPVLRTFIHVPLAGPGATGAGAAGSYGVELDTVMTCSPCVLFIFYQVSHWKLRGFMFYVTSLSPHSLCQLSLFFLGLG